MRQTTSGEIHRKETIVKIKDRKFLNNFLSIDSEDYQKLSLSGTCLHEGKSLNSSILNYLNKSIDDVELNKIKKLLVNEYDECEKIYPYAGELFIKYYHEGFKKRSFKGQLLNKTLVNNFSKSLDYHEIKSILNIIISKFSIEYFVSIKNTKGNNIIVEKDNQNIFNAEYDFDYFEKLKRPIKNYRYLIIDGVIDSVGEIHHLLHESSNNKEDYVIFCRGCHPEVKNTILKNNLLGKTNVYLVCFEVNEMNINILNDIAFLHGTSNVISSQKGQTISQAIRKKLKIGSRIEFKRGKLHIENLCNDREYSKYRKRIDDRIKNASNDKNKEILLNRYRNLQNKKLNIYIPDIYYKDMSFMRELHYFLSFLSHINKKFCKVALKEKNVYIPSDLISFIQNKLNSIKKTINNIEYILFRVD